MGDEVIMPAKNYLRYMPQLRSAYVERFIGGPSALTAFSNEEYLDPSIVDGDRYRKVSRGRAVRLVARGRWDVVALPEPFWIVELPFTTLLATVAKLSARARGGRVSVVSYAIENADPRRLLGLPGRVPEKVRLGLLRLAVLPYMHLIDRLAFGTTGAAENYLEESGAVPAALRSRTRSFAPVAPACDCAVTEKDPNLVLFLGPLEDRKGIATLLRAWPSVTEARPESRLVVCGTGPLQGDVQDMARDHRSVTHVVTSSREEMHRLLRSATVLASLPQPSNRWREQIGLSLTEGVSHGCHVVTSEQSGFASWLVEHGHTVVVSPTPDLAANAVVQALNVPTVTRPLPAISGRAEAEWWMVSEIRPGEDKRNAAV